MRERTQAYHRAVEIEIAAAEEGLLEGEGFPTWADEIRYEPTPTEAAEAGQLFGELASLEEEAEFQAWLEGLHQDAVPRGHAGHRRAARRPGRVPRGPGRAGPGGVDGLNSTIRKRAKTPREIESSPAACFVGL